MRQNEYLTEIRFKLDFGSFYKSYIAQYLFSFSFFFFWVHENGLLKLLLEKNSFPTIIILTKY